MTYLEIVNEVLVLMRLDTITTVSGVEDEAVKVVLSHVNAAKRKVENAWRWNALRDEWNLTLVSGTQTYALADTYDQVIFDQVLLDQGWELNPMSLRDMNREFAKNSNESNNPLYYAVNGMNASREVTMKFWPPVATDTPVTVHGWKTQAPLTIDSDTLLVPAYPVIYEALAMSARERGEVGGQTALEIFGMAKRYLADAIALDSSMSPYDSLWYSV